MKINKLELALTILSIILIFGLFYFGHATAFECLILAYLYLIYENKK